MTASRSPMLVSGQRSDDGAEPSQGKPDNDSGGAAKEGAQALREVVGLVLGQLSAVAALAFYFGWAHTNAFLHYFGLSTSVVSFSATDYVISSIGAAYWPLMGSAAFVVVGLAVHPRIRARVAAMSETRRRAALGLPVLLGLVMFIVAGAGLLQVWIFPSAVPVIPLLITGGVAFLTYAAVLYSDGPVDGRTVLRKAQFVALAGLIAGGVFWAWGSYAGQLGTSAARDTAARLAYQTDVSVFSTQKLSLAGPGIHFDAIGDDESLYRYRYTGLRLLVRSDNRYFLLPKGWERGKDPVIVLSESHDVRLQFVAPPYP